MSYCYCWCHPKIINKFQKTISVTWSKRTGYCPQSFKLGTHIPGAEGREDILKSKSPECSAGRLLSGLNGPVQPKHKSLQLNRSLPWLAVNRTSPSECSLVGPLAELELFRAFVCGFLRTQRTSSQVCYDRMTLFYLGSLLARMGPFSMPS